MVSDGSNGGSENGTINRGCIEASGRSNYPLTTGTTTFIGTDESGHKITLHVTVDAPVEKMTFATYYDSPGDENSFRDENLQIENGKVIGSMAENGKEYYYYLIVSPGCNLSIPKNLLIESSNEEIATVSWVNEDDWSNKNRFWTSPVPDEEDKEPYYARIKVSSLSPGTTTITATLDDNGMIWTDSFELTVTEPEQGSNPVPNVPVQIPSVPVPTTPDTTAPNIPASTNTTTANISKPAKMKAPVVKAGKKKLTVSWKKDSKVDGYQIQYSTNNKFKKAKSLNCSKKTTKNTIKKLKSGKKYYIRIRAYKKISGKKYYGNWSKAKTVKVK